MWSVVSRKVLPVNSHVILHKILLIKKISKFRISKTVKDFLRLTKLICRWDCECHWGSDSLMTCWDVAERIYICKLEKFCYCKTLLVKWYGECVTVLCKSNANEIRRCSFFVLANFRAKVRTNFRAMSSEKFRLQTIFPAIFRRNIARYFERSNEKSLLRKFTEA